MAMVERHVIFHNECDEKLIEEFGGVVTHPLNALPNLLIVQIPEENAQWLEGHYTVKKVHEPQHQETVKHYTKNYAQQAASMGWHLERMRAKDYWDRGLTGKGIKVMNWDTGIAPHWSIYPAGGIDAGNIVMGDWRYDPNVEEDTHGTCTLGLMIAKPFIYNNTIIGGMAPDAKGYTAHDGGDDTWENQLVKMINFILEQGIDIVSCSLGYTASEQYYPSGYAAFNTLLDSEVIWCQSSGNDAGDIAIANDWPLNDPRILVVGAHDINNNVSAFSSWGWNLSFIAPGTSVPVMPGNVSTSAATATWSSKTGSHSGTSYSTPITAGAIALYKQMYPNLSKKDLLDKIINTGVKKIGNVVTWDKFRGHGVIKPNDEIMALPRASRGKGLELNGIGEHVDAGKNSSLDIRDNLTLIAKFNQNFRNSGHVIAKSKPDGSLTYYGLQLKPDGISIQYAVNGVQQTQTIPRSLADEHPHTVAVVFNKPTISVFVDGVKQPFAFTNFNTSMDLAGLNANLFIGSNQGATTGSFGGIVHHVKVYSRSLSDAEILTDFQGGNIKDSQMLYHEFTGAEAGTVTDKSPYGNNGTVNGGRPNTSGVLGTNKLVQTPTATGVTVNPTDHTNVISWTAVPGAKNYEIYSISTTTGKSPIGVSATTSFTHQILPDNTQYSYAIVALDSAGNRSARSNIVVATTLVDTTPPSAVTNLKGNPRDVSVALSWNASSSNDIIPFGHYEVYYGVQGTSFASATKALDTNIISATVGGLTPSTAYVFYVIAEDGKGQQSAPTSVNASTIATSSYGLALKDDFTVRAASTTTLGTPQVGVTAYSYVNTSQKFGLDANGAYTVSGYSSSSLSTPFYQTVDTNDYQVEMVINKIGTGYTRLMFRFQDVDNYFMVDKGAANTYFFGRFSSANGWYPVGSNTPMVTLSEIDTGVTRADGDKIKVINKADGRIQLYINDVLIKDVVDTNLLNSGKVAVALTANDSRIKSLAIYQQKPVAADTFTRADNSTTMGATEVGSYTYAITSGSTMGIINNQAYGATGASWIKPTYITVPVNHYAVSIKMATIGSYSPALYVRSDGTTGSYFNAFWVTRKNYDVPTGTGGQWTLEKVVNGISTTLATSTQTCADGDVIRVERSFDGILNLYVNGNLEGSATDTYLSAVTNNKIGFAPCPNAKLDDFTVELLSS